MTDCAIFARFENPAHPAPPPRRPHPDDAGDLSLARTSSRRANRPRRFPPMRIASARDPGITRNLPNETWTPGFIDLDANPPRRFRFRNLFHPQRSLGLGQHFL